MFIAMNRFKVAKGSETAFEQVWLSRDSHLDKVPGEGAAVHYDNEVIEASSDQEAIGKAGAWAASHRLGVVATLIVKQGVGSWALRPGITMSEVRDRS